MKKIQACTDQSKEMLQLGELQLQPRLNSKYKNQETVYATKNREDIYVAPIAFNHVGDLL
ncbi:MAG: hypothetical protein ACI814_002364 [Mariniblastus sp.]|jgi:hypothetical protein